MGDPRLARVPWIARFSRCRPPSGLRPRRRRVGRHRQDRRRLPRSPSQRQLERRQVYGHRVIEIVQVEKGVAYFGVELKLLQRPYVRIARHRRNARRVRSSIATTRGRITFEYVHNHCRRYCGARGAFNDASFRIARRTTAGLKRLRALPAYWAAVEEHRNSKKKERRSRDVRDSTTVAHEILRHRERVLEPGERQVVVDHLGHRLKYLEVTPRLTPTRQWLHPRTG
jgi:ribosomal protein L35